MKKLLFFLVAMCIPAATSGADLRIELQGGIAGRVYATVFFDGNPADCFVDTGANISKVYTGSFSEKYASTGTTKFTGAAGGWVDADTIFVKEMRIDDFRATDLTITRIREPRAPDNSMGILGIDFFHEGIFTFDIPGKRLSFKDRDTLPGTKQWPLKTNEENYILFDSDIAGDRILSIFDTGAGLTTVDKKYQRNNPGHFTFIQKINDVRDSTNRVVASVDLYKMKSVKIGDAEFRDFYVLVSDFDVISRIERNIRFIVGYNLIAQKSWRFDMKAMKFEVR